MAFAKAVQPNFNPQDIQQTAGNPVLSERSTHLYQVITDVADCILPLNMVWVKLSFLSTYIRKMHTESVCHTSMH
ncbi:hypothetical protein Q8A67_003100 [Cirrhinus molitorella]|uniref:Uncharacterized protein n=1 Tax=Cirrhinus molitorella TaxID=172907 RepID=A0AA88TXJ5_9TELE|nr:hypothetical protein Q8A67_003100 [Cirrhinus molitorella]